MIKNNKQDVKKAKSLVVVNSSDKSFLLFFALFLFILIPFSSAQGLINPSSTTKSSFFTGNLTNLSEMQDVNIPTPTDAQFLRFLGATNKWVGYDFLISDYWDYDYTDLINNPTTLSQFTDNLGNRGYTSVSNFTNNQGFYNSTTLPNLNSTGLIINWNSTGYIKDWNASGFITNQTQDLSGYYLNTNPYGFYNSTNPQTETDPHWTANQSSYSTTAAANLLYYDLGNSLGYYNSTTLPNLNSTGLIIDWNSTRLIIDWNSTGYIKDWNASGLIKNWTVDTNTFYLTSNPFGFYNSTTIPAYILTETDPLWTANQSSYSTKTVADTLYYALSNPYGYYNVTSLPSLPETDPHWSGNYSTYLTLFNWNKTYADTLYYDKANSNAYYNSTTIPTYLTVETDPHWTSNKSLYPKITELVGFVGNWTLDKTSYSTTAQANGLYYPISSNPNAYYNSTNPQAMINSSYYLASNPMNYINSTYNSTYDLTSQDVTANRSSWASTYNSTYNALNSTGLIKDWNSTGYIRDWNNTQLIRNWTVIGNGMYVPYTGSNANVALGDYNFSVGTTDLFVNSNGNVGIGTTSPGQKLEVSGVTRFNTDQNFSIGSEINYNRLRTYSSEPTIRFLDSANNYASLGFRELSVGATYGGVDAPTNGAIIEGNVGIGTTSPLKPLTIESNTPTIRLQAAGNPASYFTDISSPYSSINPFNIVVNNYGTIMAVGKPGGYTGTPIPYMNGYYGSAILGDNTFGIFVQGHGSTAGNVGIGTTSPQNTLNVVGNGNFTGNLYSNGVLVGAGNTSWNQSLANTLYYGLTNPYGFYNSTTLPDLNSTGLIIDWNSTGYIKNWNASGFITNQSQDLSGYYLNTNPYGFYNSTTIPTYLTAEVDPYWTANQSSYSTKLVADTLYYDLGNSLGYYNSTTLPDLNSTGLIIDWNSTGYIKNWNASGLIKDWTTDTSGFYSITNPYGYYNITSAPVYKNDTFSGNYSNYLTLFNWNKTYADTLYYGLSNPNAYYNVTTLPATSEVDPYWTANFTAYNSSWSSTYNSTYNTWAYNQTTAATSILNGTGLIKDWNYTGYIKDWNSSSLIINWSNVIPAGSDNSTWNQTLATSLYYPKLTNPSNYWNSTFATFNKTYADTLYSGITEPRWTGNSTLVPYLASNNVFTGNQTVEAIIFEADTTNHKIFDNSTCTIITGDTSRIEVC